jgi:hypothetical protein
MSRGDEFLHLGGGLGASSDDSLFMFKSGFSPVRHRYDTLRVIADEPAYRRLVEDRARQEGVAPSHLFSSGYFPAYRAS